MGPRNSSRGVGSAGSAQVPAAPGIYNIKRDADSHRFPVGNFEAGKLFELMRGPVSKVQRSLQTATLSKVSYKEKSETQYQVELLGLDVFDPISMEVDHQSGNDVPAWFLDTDYNGNCFHVSQAFFPRTSAWKA